MEPSFWSLLLGTVLLRPYVFLFLLVYLIASTLQFGLKRTLSFAVLGYLVVFLTEYSSTRTGIPFGWYYYIDTTRNQELWISNVPFMDSLSFVFLAYASYTTAILLCAPLWRPRYDFQVIDTKAIRRSPAVTVLTVMLFVLIDIVIDPVALRGSRWFLGQIYGYYTEGVYFGVPFANFVGWAVVGLLLVTLHRFLDGVFLKRPQRQRDWGVRWVPYCGLMGPLLYGGTYGFNVFMTFAIGEDLLGTVDLLLMAPLLLLACTQVIRRTNQATQADLDAHGRDFPHSPLRVRWHTMQRWSHSDGPETPWIPIDV